MFDIAGIKERYICCSAYNFKPYMDAVNLYLTLRCNCLGVSLRWLKDRNHHRFFSGHSMMTMRNGVWRGVGTFGKQLVAGQECPGEEHPVPPASRTRPFASPTRAGATPSPRSLFLLRITSHYPPGQSRTRSPKKPVEREDAKTAGGRK